ncbi:MAG: hypothetical protein OXQ84_05010 [bacterium]|nr:hypothetical protein [bacterium]
MAFRVDNTHNVTCLHSDPTRFARRNWNKTVHGFFSSLRTNVTPHDDCHLTPDASLAAMELRKVTPFWQTGRPVPTHGCESFDEICDAMSRVEQTADRRYMVTRVIMPAVLCGQPQRQALGKELKPKVSVFDDPSFRVFVFRWQQMWWLSSHRSSWGLLLPGRNRHSAVCILF